MKAFVLLLVGLASCGRVGKLVKQGEAKELRDRQGPSNPERPDLLIVAIDGAGRDLLYDMVRRGELPGMRRLLGRNAYFDGTMSSVLPSTTMPAWSAAFTGAPPAENGVTGNEMFVREEDRMLFFAPGSTRSMDSSIEVFTDRLLGDELRAPTVYATLRLDEPGIIVWVAMSQVYGGADRLLMADRSIILDEVKAFLGDEMDVAADSIYAQLDEAIVANVIEDLGKPTQPIPDVLTVYLPGLDLYTHKAKRPPEIEQRIYLRETVDPLLGRLADELAEHAATHDRWVIVVSDHGHTDTIADERHSMHDGPGDPPTILRGAGFRVRPFLTDAPGDHQAVLALQGPMAYVYLADRSVCPRAGDRCDWTRPPRFRRDVVPAADAFLRDRRIDLVLTRRPRPHLEDDAPFQVYLGRGRMIPIADYLRRNPRPDYVDLERGLRDLAEGRYGERAGDILLISRFGGERRVEDRFYFSWPYESWHGSPSRADSEVPLIVAHPRRSRAEIARTVREVIGESPRLQKLAPLIVRLRGATPSVAGRTSR